jgi:hypothetical protein
MHTRLLVRSSFLVLLFAGVVWYAGPGAPQPAAAGLESVQQSRGPGGGPGENLLHATRRVDRCAVRAPSADMQAMIEATANRSKPGKGQSVTVPVYWHIITTSDGEGDVSGLVTDQMQVLNTAFADSGFSFDLQEVEVVANDAWFLAEVGSDDEVAMKAALRDGGPESLNIYTTNGDVYLGWATFPFYYKFAPSYDGVVLYYATLPGTGFEFPYTTGEEPDGVITYDQGDTGTHEVGHWLGLYHTFGNGTGCSHPGDMVRDTPIEAEPQFFCARRDSCVGAQFRGEDPITNFMDYVDDVCMDHFTADQFTRMHTHWHAFRDKKARE